MDKTNKVLTKIGLSSQEIEIYLVLLRSKDKTAPEISKQTNIDKATTYRLLKKLQHKGLVSEVIKNNIKTFTAADPEQILENIKILEEEFKQTLPELRKIQKSRQEKAKVEFYEGIEGVKTVMKDMIYENKPYTLFGHTEYFFDELPLYTDIWMSAMERRKTPGKLLNPKSENFKVGKNETLRYLPEQLASLISTCTYGNKTALFIMTEPPFVVLIDNAEITKTQKKIFNYIWKQSKPHKK